MKFKNIIVYGNPGEGKTILCNMLVSDYKRIYSNVDFFQNGKKINVSTKNLATLNMIRYEEEPGIVIIDEGGINLNSRRFMTDKNMDFGNLLFLGRKINCYFVWISQRFKSLDVNQRELADLVLRMYKVSRYQKHPLFIATREKMINNKLIFDSERKLDIIAWMKATCRSYNTLETSKVQG